MSQPARYRQSRSRRSERGFDRADSPRDLSLCPERTQDPIRADGAPSLRDCREVFFRQFVERVDHILEHGWVDARIDTYPEDLGHDEIRVFHRSHDAMRDSLVRGLA